MHLHLLPKFSMKLRAQLVLLIYLAEQKLLPSYNGWNGWFPLYMNLQMQPGIKEKIKKLIGRRVPERMQ